MILVKRNVGIKVYKLGKTQRIVYDKEIKSDKKIYWGSVWWYDINK